MTTTLHVDISPQANSVISECLSDRYDAAVAVAKGKYYLEHVAGNDEGVRLFNRYTQPKQTWEQLGKDYINNIPSIEIFFPVYYFKSQTVDFPTVCRFCVLCEINAYLKRIVPSVVKKAKAIGTYQRLEMTVGEEVELREGEQAMELDDSFHRDEDRDGQGEGDNGSVRRYALFEASGVFHIKHLNKVYVFKKGTKRVRIRGVDGNRIVFEEVGPERRNLE